MGSGTNGYGYTKYTKANFAIMSTFTITIISFSNEHLYYFHYYLILLLWARSPLQGNKL